MKDFVQKITFLVILAVTNAAPTKKVPTKTKVDIRVVRSSYPQQETNGLYVLSPAYHQSRQEETQVTAEHNSHNPVSVVSEAQYEALLRQAQKALRGYDLSKLKPTATAQPMVEQAPQTEAPKPQVSIKYVYTDAQPEPAYQSLRNAYARAMAYSPAANNYAASASYAPAAYSKVEEEDHGYDHYSKHKFGYRVHDPHTGAAFGHSEVSEGHVTRGHYHVLLPDGRLQNVKYVADPSGYHATVTYESYKPHA